MTCRNCGEPVRSVLWTVQRPDGPAPACSETCGKALDAKPRPVFA